MELLCIILLVFGGILILSGSNKKKDRARDRESELADQAEIVETSAREAQDAISRAQQSDGKELEQAVMDARNALRRAEAGWNVCKNSSNQVAVSRAEEWLNVAREASVEVDVIARMKGVNVPRLKRIDSEDETAEKRKHKQKQQWF